MQVDVEMYLAASPPLFSPLSTMGPLDVASGLGSRSITSNSSRRRAYGPSSSFRCGSNSSNSSQRSSLVPAGLDFDFGNMTLSPALIRSTAAGAAASSETISSLFGRRMVNGFNTSTGRSSTSPFITNSSSFQQQLQQPQQSNGPLRSCLVIRPEEDSGSSSGCSSEPSSPLSDKNESSSGRLQSKKRVVFADSKGLSLTQVKMMTEPSDCPPRWTAEFLEQVTGGASADIRTADRWELSFAQPASDYLEFRSRLDSQNVSLENVVVADEAPGGGQQLVGTIKVKNLSFSKRVTVRITFDNWATQMDVDAVFASPLHLQGSGGGGGGTGAAITNLFDTFSFKISIPPVVSANKIQFCIRFISDAGEYWDNNLNKNYVIVKPVIEPAPHHAKSNHSPPSSSRTFRSGSAKYSDLLSPGSKVDLWAGFASWNHLVNDSPYW